MDPDYENFVMFTLADEGMELSSYPNDDVEDNDIDYEEEEELEEEEEEEEEDEEEEEEDEEEEEEEDEEEEEEEEDEEEEEEEEDEDEDDNSGRLIGDNRNDINAVMASSQGVVNVDGLVSNIAGDESSGKGRDTNDSNCVGSAPLKDGDGEYGKFNRGEADGLFCPVCFEGWSSGGDHHVCCLPCGHIYGLSCIKKWLDRPGSSRCPQCKKKCRIKDIRLLYATRIVAIDGELQKKVQSLEAKCASLEKQGVESSRKEAEWKKKEADLCEQVQFLKEGVNTRLDNIEGRIDLWKAETDARLTDIEAENAAIRETRRVALIEDQAWRRQQDEMLRQMMTHFNQLRPMAPPGPPGMDVDRPPHA